MAKQVKISSISEPFPTITAAQAYFEELKTRNIDGDILTGIDADDVKAAYEGYCQATNWPIPNGIVGFSVGNKVEEVSPGQFRTQKCFWYHLPDRSKHDFSIIKAIKAISKQSS